LAGKPAPISFTENGTDPGNYDELYDDERAAMRFLTKTIRRHGVPETITINGSEAHAAAIRGYNAAYGTAIIIRQVKYLNNVVEQDHRTVKRITRPMQGFKSFDAAGYAHRD
jgi:putative transposase